MPPHIGITMGDPLGIGPELILKLMPKFASQAQWTIFGDADLLPGLSVQPGLFQGPQAQRGTHLWAGQASVAYLEAAMAAWRSGQIQALVTAPIAKAHVKSAGFAFPGHTEYLAKSTGSAEFAMMMAAPELKVVLVTIHEPLKRVPELLNVDKILTAIRLTHEALRRDFGIAAPRIAVCGLNPHAGEQGHLGSEEIEIIAPALEEARRQGWACSGPLVPDAVFHQAREGLWDAVVCMYHDQGLIPFKMLHFRDGVNVTLGLPLVRTSPDHGTAFDIAGRGVADPSSMRAAMDLAIRMLEVRP